MSIFQTYFTLGFYHISDLGAYDHIVFILALCAVYKLQQWRHVAILVTAFTIGHSITLAIATLGLLFIPTTIIEFLIPVTILSTCLTNVFKKTEKNNNTGYRMNYLLAMFFGLIHGMGFSNYLRMLLGQEEAFVLSLFAFNVGLEIGQLLIVFFVLLISFVSLNIFKIIQREWNLFVSGIAAGVAIILMSKTFPW